mgnify:CR=1 FL=1
MKPIDTFQNRLQKAMNIRNMKQVDLVEKTGLDKTLLSKYLSGISNARQDKLTTLAEALQVNEIWLMGYDIPMESIPIKNIEKIKIPVLGTVKAGYDYLAQENIIGYESIDNVSDPENYYALQVTGNSMEPLFSDGDIAIVHKQDNFDSGNTCIILVNGDEATVKKVVRMDDGIDLIAMNPYYPVRHFSKNEMNEIPVKIIGKVVEARKRKAFE